MFVWPRDGIRPASDERTTWAVGQINYRTRNGGWVTGSGRYVAEEPDYVDLPTALEAAEVWIVESDQQLPARTASWRRNQPPSEKQQNYARTLGIVGFADMTKARLSDEISVKLASRVLDSGIER